MKKNIIKITGLTLLLSVFAPSCNWIDSSLNTDPDSPADVPMNLILPNIQQAFGYNMAGNELVRTTAIWMQQFDGVDRQSYTEARYQLLPSDVNNIWSSFYTEILMNSKTLITKAEALNSPYYAGVAKVITAATLGMATDVFGDMPYSEGLKGGENVLTPAFDTQQELYVAIFAMLDEAIADLSSTTNAVPVTGDVMYAGSAAKWKKAAYAIKVRHLMQLSQVNTTAAYNAVIAAVPNAFASNADDLQVPWETANKNPIFQFMEQRTDIRMGAKLIDLLKANNDPRLAFYAEEDGDGEYTGSIAGSENDLASKPGAYVAGATAPSVMMSYAELKFIEAEAKFRLTGAAAAQAPYEAAVAASVLKVTGAVNTGWLNANINGIPVTLEKIMEQKYIATFGTNQAYADYRRTGLPTMTLPIGAVLPAMPLRFPYPQEELTYNAANVPAVTLSTALWWDK